MNFSVFKYILEGQTLARILLNKEFKKYSFSGKILDVGGGKNPDYRSFLKIGENSEFIVLDMKQPDGSFNNIDFEKDRLPMVDSSVDNVIALNILEHIYNYRFLISEIYRVLKNNSRLIGFVPFLVNYHPDPHDYFRYTKESLNLIFKDIGFRNIEVFEIGGGPFSINYNNVMLSLPRLLRIILWPVYWFFDFIFIKASSNARVRFPLGYFFKAIK